LADQSTRTTRIEALAIEQTVIIRLSVEGQRAFAEAILNPPKASTGLRKAFKAHCRLIRELR
jgi:uncharacterized protein (DUF1778 family)